MPRSTSAIAGAGVAVLVAAVAAVAIRGTGDLEDTAPSAQVATEAQDTTEATTEPQATPTPTTPPPSDPTDEAATDSTGDDPDDARSEVEDTTVATSVSGGVDDLPDTGGGALTALGAALALGTGVAGRRRRGD